MFYFPAVRVPAALAIQNPTDLRETHHPNALGASVLEMWEGSVEGGWQVARAAPSAWGILLRKADRALAPGLEQGSSPGQPRSPGFKSW